MKNGFVAPEVWTALPVGSPVGLALVRAWCGSLSTTRGVELQLEEAMAFASGK